MISEPHELDKQFPKLFLRLLLTKSTYFLAKARNVAESSARLSCQARPTDILRVVADVLREILEVGFVRNLIV